MASGRKYDLGRSMGREVIHLCEAALDFGGVAVGVFRGDTLANTVGNAIHVSFLESRENPYGQNAPITNLAPLIPRALSWPDAQAGMNTTTEVVAKRQLGAR